MAMRVSTLLLGAEVLVTVGVFTFFSSDSFPAFASTGLFVSANAVFTVLFVDFWRSIIINHRVRIQLHPGAE